MNEGLVWIAAVLAMPLVVAVLASFPVRVERVRAVAVACAVAMLGWALLPALVPGLRLFHLSLDSEWTLLSAPLLRVDALSMVLPPFAAGLWLFTVAVTPRTLLALPGLRRTALATLFTTASFLSENPLVLVVTWTASVLTFLSALSTSRASVRRAARWYLGGSTIAFAAGTGLMIASEAGHASWGAAGMALVVLAALVRKGIFPFHAWVPAVFEDGPLGPAVLFSTPQLGTYVAAVLIVPRAPSELLRLVAILALATAVYGGALALGQRSPRRAVGYLFVSQSSLVMAGLDCTSSEALSGALVLWLSSGVAFAGLSRCLLVLEARRGALDLSRFHGGYERMPVLAAGFLLTGLTCMGFPGTLGFVGEELLVAGAVSAFPVLGFLVVVSGALTGLAVLRMYFALFCGRLDRSVQLSIRRRERLGFSAVVAFLVLTGLAPHPLVASRAEASEDLLRARERYALAPIEAERALDER